MNKSQLFKVEDWTPEEAGLLDEMKSRCFNKGQYIDKKAKDKFKMLCHLEDYGLQYYEQQKEIEILNNIIDEIIKDIEHSALWLGDKQVELKTTPFGKRILEKLKEGK